MSNRKKAFAVLVVLLLLVSAATFATGNKFRLGLGKQGVIRPFGPGTGVMPIASVTTDQPSYASGSPIAYHVKAFGTLPSTYIYDQTMKITTDAAGNNIAVNGTATWVDKLCKGYANGTPPYQCPDSTIDTNPAGFRLTHPSTGLSAGAYYLWAYDSKFGEWHQDDPQATFTITGMFRSVDRDQHPVETTAQSSVPEFITLAHITVTPDEGPSGLRYAYRVALLQKPKDNFTRKVHFLMLSSNGKEEWDDSFPVQSKYLEGFHTIPSLYETGPVRFEVAQVRPTGTGTTTEVVFTKVLAYKRLKVKSP